MLRLEHLLDLEGWELLKTWKWGIPVNWRVWSIFRIQRLWIRRNWSIDRGNIV